MGKHLVYFRPGEEARMLARCQFGAVDERCGATLTYPIKGHPWRRNVIKSYQFDLDQGTISLLYSEVDRILQEHPDQCLSADQLWNDATEKGNGVTRDKIMGKPCHTISLTVDGGSIKASFALREDSSALLNSALFRVISTLISPYESLSQPGHVA